MCCVKRRKVKKSLSEAVRIAVRLVGGVAGLSTSSVQSDSDPRKNEVHEKSRTARVATVPFTIEVSMLEETRDEVRR